MVVRSRWGAVPSERVSEEGWCVGVNLSKESS